MMLYSYIVSSITCLPVRIGREPFYPPHPRGEVESPDSVATPWAIEPGTACFQGINPITRAGLPDPPFSSSGEMISHPPKCGIASRLARFSRWGRPYPAHNFPA